MVFGIFGKMFDNFDYSLYIKGIFVVFLYEVKEGLVEILIVVEGQQVECFVIDIVYVVD